MAIALSGQLLLGQPVMVKPSEAEKNLVPSNASAGGAPSGLYGAIDRKLYVGNLHFNMTEIQLRQVLLVTFIWFNIQLYGYMVVLFCSVLLLYKLMPDLPFVEVHITCMKHRLKKEKHQKYYLMS